MTTILLFEVSIIQSFGENKSTFTFQKLPAKERFIFVIFKSFYQLAAMFGWYVLQPQNYNNKSTCTFQKLPAKERFIFVISNSFYQLAGMLGWSVLQPQNYNNKSTYTFQKLPAKERFIFVISKSFTADSHVRLVCFTTIELQ